MPPKKGGKKNKNDDWDDEAAERKIAALKLAEQSETNWDDEPPKPKPKKAAKKGFAAMLMDDDEVDNGDDDVVIDEPEPEPEPEIVETKPEKEKKNKKDKKKKDKKEKKAADEEEDLDAILASFESKDAAVAPKPKEASPSTDEQPKDEAVAKDDAEHEADKKNKKKKKKGKKDADKNEDAGTPPPDDEAKPSEEKADNADGDDDDEKDNDGEDGEKDKKDKKKQKKKDKKKEKEKKEKEEKKGGKKGQLSLIKEMLKKQQELREEQERLAKEEQERLEQLEKEREEKEKALREKKEAAKEAKRLEIERQKAAGTYKTAAQRKQQQLALEKLRAAGLNVPDLPRETVPEEKKKGSFVYMDEKTKAKLEEKKRKRLEKQGLIQPKEDKSEESTPSSMSPAPPEPVKDEVEEKKDEPVDDWDKDEPLDDWEMAEDVIEEKQEVKKTTDKKSESKKAESDDDDDDDDDDESDESDDSDDSDEDDETSESSEEEEETGKGRETKEQIMERVKQRIAKRREAAQSKRSVDNLRSPVICVLGHVDTGKTKMLDTIRRTNVQLGEAGGITQQIGATEVPMEAIKERCRQVRDFKADAMKIPGFLIIDTPGHESFSNLRTRGSSLCDFAILVVDIMHGLEPQTIESLKLLLKGKTPFVIALNKIDRLYEYESNPRKDIYEHLKSQKPRVQAEFKERYDKIVVEFAEQGVNVGLSNKQMEDDFIAMVPTSAYLGDGVGNLMSYIVNQTQTKHAEKLSFCDELDATVMEVKAIPGLGTTIDVILVNGTIRYGDVIVLTGAEGAIVTQVRELLMPKPLKELRVKNDYVHYKEVKGARGVKVLAKNLEKALAGLPLRVTDREDEIDYLSAEADDQLKNALHDIKKKPIGVYVMASTLGSLEALLDFLKSQKIPYSNVNIGPVHKKDVQKASAMKEHKAEYACILAFDVKVEREAQIFADHEGVKIFQADIIYHLQDSFLKYREELAEKARRENEHLAIFPCKLRVLPNHVYNTRNPIVCGVSIEAGQVKRGTPICVPSKDGILLGTISSIERNGEEVALAKQGEEVCIKIENTTGEAPKLYGRHFNHEDILVSKISRESIDVCKTYFRDELSKADWQLVVQLKKTLDIL